MMMPFLYREKRPDLRLRTYIRAYWQFRRTFKHGKTQTIYPDSFYELMWVERGTLIVDGTPAPRLFLGGFHPKPITITAEGMVEIWAVRFKPWGLAPFFPFDSVFDDKVSNPQEKIGPAAYEEMYALFEEATLRGLPKMLDTYFLRQLLAARIDSRSLMAITEHMVQSRGAARVQDIASQCELSSRHIERLIQRATGKTPRDVMARIRFEHARRELFAYPQRSLAAIAIECGYADQSHLIKDFQRFTSMTPLQLREEFIASYAHLLPDDVRSVAAKISAHEPYER